MLTQLEHLQQALWWHAITPSSARPETLAPLQFSVQQCTEEKVPTDGLPHTPPALLKRERKKKYQKTGRPHDWRTRPDPFEGEWEQITAWLTANPALTGVEIFHQLDRTFDIGEQRRHGLAFTFGGSLRGDQMVLWRACEGGFERQDQAEKRPAGPRMRHRTSRWVCSRSHSLGSTG